MERPATTLASETTDGRCPRCGSEAKFHLTFENGAKTYHCCIICTKVFPVPRNSAISSTTAGNLASTAT
nr:hypothetical protein [Candidatus Sigynarchaeota archaeon]